MQSKTTYIGSLFEVTKNTEEETGTLKTTLTKHIFAGSTRICSIQTTNNGQQTTSYYHPDHLGSSNVITGADGALVQQIILQMDTEQKTL